MDPLSLAMLFGSIGLQFFNNSATNKKSEELRKKQNDAQRAAALHDFKRMHRLQEQSAKLALEVEAELHRQRMEDIENNYDTILQQIAHSAAISAWPLTVLPFVMRGESFGRLTGGGCKTLSLHCIVTPSNYELFNQLFYDSIDMLLEEKMNAIWNAQSDHPVVYYGGCWKKHDLKGNVSRIDLNEVDILRSQLKSLPTMVITPYFNPGLHFRIKLWGMGKDIDVRLELSGEMFSHIDFYEIGRFPKDNETRNTFYAATIDQMVPYLQSLIGFVADKYFWSMYGVKPMLPEIAQQQSQTRLIFREKLFPIYQQTLSNGLQQKEDYIRAISYVDSLSSALSDDEKNRMLTDLYQSYVGMQGGQDELDTLDLSFLERIRPQFGNGVLSGQVSERIDAIRSNEDILVWFCANKNELLQHIVNEREKFVRAPSHFVIEYRSDFYAVGCFCGEAMKAEYSEEGVAYYAVLMANEEGEKCASIDVGSLQEADCEHLDLCSHIALDEQHLLRLYDAQRCWLQDLCQTEESTASLLARYLADAPVINFSYQNLRDWIEYHACQPGTVNAIMGFSRREGRYFYIVSGNACSEVFACYCNTIEETMREKFNNKTILSITIT